MYSYGIEGNVLRNATKRGKKQKNRKLKRDFQCTLTPRRRQGWNSKSPEKITEDVLNRRHANSEMRQMSKQRTKW